jgi:hypothetical protein
MKKAAIVLGNFLLVATCSFFVFRNFFVTPKELVQAQIFDSELLVEVKANL